MLLIKTEVHDCWLWTSGEKRCCLLLMYRLFFFEIVMVNESVTFIVEVENDGKLLWIFNSMLCCTAAVSISYTHFIEVHDNMHGSFIAPTFEYLRNSFVPVPTFQERSPFQSWKSSSFNSKHFVAHFTFTRYLQLLWTCKSCELASTNYRIL